MDEKLQVAVRRFADSLIEGCDSLKGGYIAFRWTDEHLIYVTKAYGVYRLYSYPSISYTSRDANEFFEFVTMVLEKIFTTFINSKDYKLEDQMALIEGYMKSASVSQPLFPIEEEVHAKVYE